MSAKIHKKKAEAIAEPTEAEKLADSLRDARYFAVLACIVSCICFLVMLTIVYPINDRLLEFDKQFEEMTAKFETTTIQQICYSTDEQGMKHYRLNIKMVTQMCNMTEGEDG